MSTSPRSVRFDRKSGNWRGSFIAMGSPCEVLVETGDESVAREIAELASSEAWRIEDKFSRYLSGNIIDTINTSKGEPVVVDDETANLLDFASTLYDLSDGKFDITSGVLREAWTFDGGDRLPDSALVDEILDKVGWQKVNWQRPKLTMHRDMQIDLGGIGKEYAVDRAAGLVAESTECACLVNFGGDLVALQAPAGSDGWQVGIEALDSEKQVASKKIRLLRGGLATSGDARRFLVKDGVRYGHILDPTTGWPIENAPRSITVAADTCTQAGMLATLAMLKGNAAESFLDEQKVQYWCFR